MPLAPLPVDIIPLDSGMFPDVVVFSPITYSVGIHGGPVPVPGTPITLSCYVEETSNAQTRQESMGSTSAGAVLGEVVATIYFRDPGTGDPPIASDKDSQFSWISSQGKAFSTPKILLAKDAPDRQGSLWFVDIRSIT